MEALPREELERLVFFESAREQAELDWKQNPRDAQALTRWGGALLELAHFRQGPEAVEYIEMAVAKFEQALAIDENKHDALWCLGNALTSQGFLFAERDKAMQYFNKAKACFEKAVKLEPRNEVYKKALEMTAKAPALHAELQKQFAQQHLAAREERGGASGSGSSPQNKAKGVDNEWMYDAAGWVLLGVLVTGWVYFSSKAAAAAAK